MIVRASTLLLAIAFGMTPACSSSSNTTPGDAAPGDARPAAADSSVPSEAAATQDGSVTDTSTADTAPAEPDAASDSAPADSAVVEAGPHDAGSEAAADAAAEAAAPVGSTLLASGGGILVYGVTSDDLVIYVQQTSQTVANVLAVPIAGGSPITITTIDPSAQYSVGTQGPDVLVWAGAGTIAPQLIWTHAAGLKTLAAAAPVSGVLLGSFDGTQLLYLDNATATSGDLYLANNDATGKTKLLTATSTTSCNLSATIIGGTVIVQHCESATTVSPTLSLFPGGVATGRIDLGVLVASENAQVAGNAYPSFAVDDSGDLLFAILATGEGATFSIPGGAKTSIAPAATQGFLSSDGTSVLYVTPAGSLEVSPTTSPTPTALVSNGVKGVLSATDSQVAYYTQLGTSPFPGETNTDLWVASSSMPGPGTAIVATPTAVASPYGALYTADSTHLTYFTGVEQDPIPGIMPWVAALHASLTTGGSPTTLAGAAAATLGSVSLGSGAKVVYLDTFNPPSLTWNLEAADLSLGPTPKLIAPSVQPEYAVSADGTKVAYSTQLTGLYVATIP